MMKVIVHWIQQRCLVAVILNHGDIAKDVRNQDDDHRSVQQVPSQGVYVEFIVMVK